MYSKIVFIAVLVAAINAAHHGGQSYINYNLHNGPAVAVEFKDKHGHKDIDYYAHPKYEFKYGVEDEHTHDHKSQGEHRDGDKVVGEYTIKEADGTLRTVKYVADKHTGFNAEVTRSGHATHPAVYGHDGGHGDASGHGHDGDSGKGNGDTSGHGHDDASAKGCDDASGHGHAAGHH